MEDKSIKFIREDLENDFCETRTLIRKIQETLRDCRFDIKSWGTSLGMDNQTKEKSIMEINSLFGQLEDINDQITELLAKVRG